MRLITSYTTVIIAFFGFSTIAPALSSHPLDGLTGEEYAIIADVLDASGKTNKSTQFVTVALADPDKASVLTWQEGDAFDRRGLAVIRQDRKLYEAIINITNGTLESWDEQEGAQPILLDNEWVLSQVLPRQNEEWIAALARRGIDNPRNVFCFPRLSWLFRFTA